MLFRPKKNWQVHMRKILMIARDDIRALCSNAISILVVIGLICMPSIYGWFNIAGS